MAKNDSNSLIKVFQFKFYSFLSSRWGMALCILGAFISFNTVFQLLSVFSLSNNGYYTLRLDSANEFTNNVGGDNYKSMICSDPIDIVYTWVNGSDANLIKAVNDLKRSLRDPSIPECTDKQDPTKNKCYRDDNPASRFIDNQELKYSLRSVEQFAPWIRQIFLVTNGQVPNWLDLSNPKITVVTHEEIFVNKSHLPTFSSPSIETHIHRIPGLSKHFLYLNDDVMFGRPVYPDDFITKGGGQKVFLSWPVPNCNDGCPNNWVGDGFCDTACNVTLCDFDGGDCDNSTGKVKTRWWNRHSGGSPTGRTSDTRVRNYCSKSCPDAWIGDKHCDRHCKNLDCGFDAGDCGVEIMFSEMLGYEITNQTHIDITNGTTSVYFNLTKLVGEATITDGSHDNAVLVRTATISQKNKIMTLTFHHNIAFQQVSISISYEGPNKTTLTKDFNVTLSTIPLPSNSTDSTDITPAPTNTPVVTSVFSNGGAGYSKLRKPNFPPRATPLIEEGQQEASEESSDQEALQETEQESKQRKRELESFLEEIAQISEESTSSSSENDVSIEREDTIKEMESILNQPHEEQSVSTFLDSKGEETKLFSNNNDEQSKIVGSTEYTKQELRNNDKRNNDLDQLDDKIFDFNLEQDHNRYTARDTLSIEEQQSKDDKQTQEKEEDQQQQQQVSQLQKQESQLQQEIVVEDEDQFDPNDLIIMKYIERLNPEQVEIEQVYLRKEVELLNNQLEDTETVALKKYMKNRELEQTLKEEGEIYPWEEAEDIKSEKPAPGSRKLMDMFGDSLKYVNRLYTVEFGSSPRKVPAHMPHMIDKDLMEEIQKKWPNQWELTSSHSLRNPKDMQYAFSYFYYLIHKKIPFDLDKLWNTEIDINRDGWLSNNEMRSLAVNIYGTPLRPTAFKEFKSTIYKTCVHLRDAIRMGEISDTLLDEPDNTTVLEIDDYQLQECHITLDVLKANNKTMVDMKNAYSKRTFYHTTIEGTDEVAFLMIDDNYTVTQSRLDGVRQRRQKFICLNDNINHDKPSAPLAVKVIHDFYESLFPFPSSFELPKSKTNHFHYINEIVTLKKDDNERNNRIIIIFSSLIVFVIFLIWKQRKSRLARINNKKYYIV